MLDMQKERLRHLMSSAILELWKKETGSTTSVYIEGTVCITTKNGRTTVIHVSDQFPGSIPERERVYPDENLTNDETKTPTRENGNSTFDCPSPVARGVRFNSEGGQQSYRDQINGRLALATNFSCGRRARSKKLFGELKSSHADTRVNGGAGRENRSNVIRPQFSGRNHQQLMKDANNNHAGEVNAELSPNAEDSSRQVKVESSSSSSEEDEDIGSGSSDADNPATPAKVNCPVFPGAGYYGDVKIEKSDVKKDSDDSDDDAFNKDDSAIQDMSIDLSHSELNNSSKHLLSTPGMFASTALRTPKRASGHTPQKDGSAKRHDSCQSGGKGSKSAGSNGNSDLSGVDLSRQQRDNDLFISSPHSYTVQVRDAIRRRLLATTSYTMMPQFSPSQPSSGNRSFSQSSPVGKISTSHSAVTSPASESAKDFNLHSISADVFRKMHESPYGRSLGMGGAVGPSVLWGMPPAPAAHSGNTKQQPVSTGSLLCPATSPAGVDVRFFLPFSSPPAVHPGRFGFHNGNISMPPAMLAPPIVMTPPTHKSLISAVRNHRSSSSSSASSLAHSLHNILIARGAGGQLDCSPAGGDDKRGVASSMLVSQGGDGHDAASDTPPSPSVGGEMVGADGQHIYRCDYCSKTFLFKSKYHEHLPVHTSARPFQCHLCSRTYKYKYDLRVHLRTHLGIPTKSTVCPFCADKFTTNKLLRSHIREMHREQQQIEEKQCASSLEGLPSGGTTTIGGLMEFPAAIHNTDSDHGGSNGMDLSSNCGSGEGSSEAAETSPVADKVTSLDMSSASCGNGLDIETKFSIACDERLVVDESC